MSDVLMTTYNRLPVTFARGEGAWLWDEAGNRYLDALSGVAVCGLGHAHPKVAQAICKQAQTLVHTSNIYGIAAQQRLGERLTALSGMDRVFFSNSGAEANEAAIKLARLYGHKKGIEQAEIIVAQGSFHGRTLATLSATGNRKVQAGFEPLVRGFLRVDYNDMAAIHTIGEHHKNVVAILIEPVQGEGGINIPSPDYLVQLREVCDRHGWLLMLDEVQTGMCRTGTWFAFQHTPIKPDVMTLAKGLGNGVPIGACLARGAAAEVFAPGNHASTFGGNPLACAAALAVIDALEEGKLAQRAQQLGERMVKGFKDRLGATPGVTEVRGMGLMVGIVLDRPCAELVKRALAAGLLINVTADSVIRLLPPLIISDAECDQIIDGVSHLVLDFLSAGVSK
ncbi:MAG: aspartate aminotransferase family protein [Pseudomonadota bacterium]